MRIIPILTAAVVCLALATPPASAIDTGGHFNLTKGNTQKNAPFAVAGKNRVQAIGYDNSKGALYIAQLINDVGVKKKGKGYSASRGDLQIDKVDAGKPSVRHGDIKLFGFGHGVSIGVEPSGKANAWLWVETAAPALAKGSVSFGTRIARLRFAANHTFSYSSAGGGTIIEKDANGKKITTTARVLSALDLSGVAYNGISASIDPENSQVAVRYRTSATSSFYRVYGLKAVLTAAKPADLSGDTLVGGGYPYDGGAKANFEGYALYRGWIYVLTGKLGKSNVRLAAFDIYGNHQTWAAQSYSAPKMPNASEEPEGVAIDVVSGVARLRWAITGTVGGANRVAIFQANGAMLPLILG